MGPMAEQREGVGVSPRRAASVVEAIARAGGRPLVLEAVVDGVPMRVGRTGDDVSLPAALDAATAAAVTAALRTIEARDVVVDLVAGADGVRFIDLVELDGESWALRPAAARLAELGEISPVGYMVERTSVVVPEWAEAFVDHVRERGARGVWLRLADAALGDPDAWQVVEF